MITIFLRSSSYSCWDVCQHKYVLDYLLGIKTPTNEKASIGNVWHKTCEILSRKKLAIQKRVDYVDCEDLGIFKLGEVTTDFAIKKAFEMYRDYEQNQWGDSEFNSMYKMITKGLDFNNGIYHPLNQNVISVEYKFDFVIDEPWAKYEFKLGDEIVEGQLGIRGTIDVLEHINDNILLFWDYKTGRRTDINTGKYKIEDDFEKDFQLNLYHYALKREFPQYECLISMIWYVNDGGPFVQPLKENAEELIKKRFEEIKRTKIPTLRKDKVKYNNWFCKYVCSHATDIYKEGKTTCDFFRDEIRKKGTDKIVEEYSNDRAWSRYSDGGGRKEKPLDTTP
jgi:hypothetical protein